MGGLGPITELPVAVLTPAGDFAGIEKPTAVEESYTDLHQKKISTQRRWLRDVGVGGSAIS
tara:strand:+ start:275 stop:457 length:183 start_codon:yes stop_codon:yes gene_type:complete